MATQYYSRSRQLSVANEGVGALLSRYPDLSKAEYATLGAAIRRLSILELSLLTADERIAAKLADFYRDHGHQLRTAFSSSVLMALCVVAIGMLWWLW